MGIYAITNQKGGTGKTTVAISLAAALAERSPEAAVLLVDLDPQGHCTEGCGMKNAYLEEGNNLYDTLVPVTNPRPGRGRSSTNNGDEINLDGLIRAVPHERFFLIPSHYKMMLAETALTPVTGREFRLETLLNMTGDAFSDIVIDCPPNLGILTDNAINASRNLVIPIQAEQTSMRALDLLLDQVETIERGLRIKVNILAIVPNLVQPSRLSRDILAGLRQNIDTTLPFDFPKRVVLQEAFTQGQSIFTYTPKDREKMQAVLELRALYQELVSTIKKEQ